MTNQKYVKCNEHLGKADIDLENDTIGLILVDSSLYTPDVDTDEFLSEISESAILFTLDGGLTGCDVTNGVFDADDVECDDIADGTVDYIILFKDTGELSSSLLIAILDDAENLPYESGEIGLKIIWSNGSNKIFRI